MKKKSDFVAIVVSYVPLLMGEAGRTDLNPEEIGPLIDGADATAKACVWLHDDEFGPVPVMLFEGARDIADHLKAWAEEKPEDWFKLVLAEHGDLYGLALMPNLDKGVERFRMAYQLRNGLPLPKDVKYQFLFKPLSFVSQPGHVFSHLRPELRQKTKVCLMDVADFKGADTDWNGAVVELGVFEIVTKGRPIQFVVEDLKRSKKEGNR